MKTATLFYVGIDVSKDKSDIYIKDENGNDLIKRLRITNTETRIEMENGTPHISYIITCIPGAAL